MQKFTLKFWRSFCLLAILLASLSFMANAQTITVKGVVTSKDDGTPLPGVSVTIKKTTQGTATDVNGAYTIKAATGTVLVFNAIGYEGLEVTVSSASLNIALDTKKNSLNEVVV